MKTENTLSFDEEISLLKKEIKCNGWYKKLQLRMALELLFHLSLMVVGIYFFLLSHSFWSCTISILISTVGATGVTTHTHSSSHQTTFKSNRINNFLVFFGYGFLFGTSAKYWWHKHIVVHHPNPNIYGIDDDIDLKPFFAFTKEDIQLSNSRIQKFLFNIQYITFPIALAFNGFNIQLSGWKFLIKSVRDKKITNNTQWVDFGVLLLHWSFWFVLPMFIYDCFDVIAFHFLRISLLGYGMYAAFAPAHFPSEALVLDRENKDINYYVKQLYTTVNFRTNGLGRLICSGVDYQIEHHLFPGVTHVFYPKISAKLKDICCRHGYPYRTLGWWEAVWKSYIIFYSPKTVVHNLNLQTSNERSNF